MEELGAAREELAAFHLAQGADRQQAIAGLENARRQLRFISLAARNLVELRVGLAGCGQGRSPGPGYFPGQAAATGAAGRHLNVEA
jgi:hypothetical protein